MLALPLPFQQIPGNSEVPWIQKRNLKKTQILKGELKEKKSHGDSASCVLLCGRPLDTNAQDKQIFFQSNSIFFILQFRLFSVKIFYVNLYIGLYCIQNINTTNLWSANNLGNCENNSSSAP